MRIGLIAGNGRFPLIFAEKARARGFDVFAAAYVKEADPSLEKIAADVKWLHLGQVGKLIRFFKKNDVDRAVMMGGVTKTRMFTDVRPDIRAISIIARMKHTHDDGVLRAFAEALEKDGIKVEAATFLLPELLAPQGVLTRRALNETETADMRLGWKVAKAVGGLDVGQCVAVSGGTVLAVEAIEGTDAAIRRAGSLARGNITVVKVCKPNQDLRFDMPAVGEKTIETMHEANATALFVEAGKAVMFDREKMIALADRYNIAVTAGNGD